MNDLTRQSERLIEEGRILRDDNRAGGRHRREGSIGEGSASLKLKHWKKKLIQLAIGTLGVFAAVSIAAAILNGIGFWGVIITGLVLVLLYSGVLSQKIKVPKRSDINKGDVRQMVSRTELWLEHQRPALPPPAVKVVEDMGVQLDALGKQLETVDQNHPAAREVRKLVGEHLPEMIDSYQRIPDHLRREARGGKTPDEQITASLGKISKEIDSVTRQLADGALDELAVKDRFLEYRYGDGETAPIIDRPEGTD
ncbi:hypothetical protein [Altererythrobacter sp. MF3-039]|uniref:hypothetical protein n=1 Tax=Altererythrobacter sp. MF3-039 TaxID=3252901 RepID=UPI00390CC3A9